MDTPQERGALDRMVEEVRMLAAAGETCPVICIVHSPRYYSLTAFYRVGRYYVSMSYNYYSGALVLRSTLSPPVGTVHWHATGRSPNMPVVYGSCCCDECIRTVLL